MKKGKFGFSTKKINQSIKIKFMNSCFTRFEINSKASNVHSCNNPFLSYNHYSSPNDENILPVAGGTQALGDF